MKPKTKLFKIMAVALVFTIAIFSIFQSCKKEIETAEPEQVINEPDMNIKNGSDPILYFGHEIVTRETGAPTTVTIPIVNEHFEHFETFVLNIQNGDGENNLVSSAIIKIDGEIIFGPADFNQNVTFLAEEINPTAESFLEVELNGIPGSYIDLWIDGTLLQNAVLVSPNGGLFQLFDPGNPNNFVIVDIPSGTIASNDILYVEFIQGPPLIESPYLERICPAIDINFSSGYSSFNNTITLTLPYILGQNEILNPSGFTYNENTGEWEIFEILEVNVANQTVSFEMNHFTIIDILDFVITSVLSEAIYPDEMYNQIQSIASITVDTHCDAYNSLKSYFEGLRISTEADLDIYFNELEADEVCEETTICLNMTMGEFRDEFITHLVAKLAITELAGWSGLTQTALGGAVFKVAGFGFIVLYTPCLVCSLIYTPSYVNPVILGTYLRYLTILGILEYIDLQLSIYNSSTSFTDPRDGQTYNTVIIGSQEWMAENLNYETGNSWCYEDDGSNCNVYGRLYDWNTALTACPSGWHLPSDDEWKILEMYLGMSQSEADDTGWRGTDEGGKMKESGTTHWLSPNTGATNSSGFSALPGGFRYSGGNFGGLGYNGYWWSATEGNSTTAWYRSLGCSSAKVPRGSYGMGGGYSVRCVRD